MPASFVTQPASRRQRAGLGTIGGLFLGFAAVGLCASGLPLPRLAAFLPFYAGIIVLTNLLTAYLLAAQFRVTGLLSIAVLSAAYLFSGLIVVPHALVLPGLVAAQELIGPDPQSASWMWVLWHGGFAVLVVAYAWVEWRLGVRKLPKAALLRWSLLLPAAVVAMVGLFGFLAARGRDLLPVLSDENGANLSHCPAGWAVILLGLVALLAVALATRCRTLGQTSLSLAMLTSLLEAVLTLHGDARFTLGWYLARVIGMVSSGSVLAMFLYEIVWLYHRLTSLTDTLERLAFVDGMTGLANRRQFDQRLEAEWARAVRDEKAIALIMLDVDFFKNFNDRYGHPAGDECLRQLARAIANVARRPGDLPARYGGEEFAVILPETEEEGALYVANCIAEAIHRLGLRHEAGTPLGVVTVSQGVAVLRPKSGDSWDLLKVTADEALYEAKKTGRNRTAIAASPTEADGVRMWKMG